MEKPNRGREQVKKACAVDEKEIQRILKTIKLSLKDSNVLAFFQNVQSKPLCKSYVSEGLREQGVNASQWTWTKVSVILTTWSPCPSEAFVPSLMKFE